MTEKEFNIMMDYLNSCELDDEGKIYFEDYIEAATKIVLPNVLDKYFRNQKIEFEDVKNQIKDTLDEFITQLNPVEGKADAKFNNLTKDYLDRGKNNVVKININSEDFYFPDIRVATDKLIEKENVEKAAVKSFREKFNNGEPLNTLETDKFFKLSIEKTVGETNDLFKNIFGVEENDKELETLKKTNEVEYKEKSAGKNPLDQKNIKTSLTSYKLMTDKIKKTGIFEMLFHLPSFFKMKSNIKKMKEQMINKGISEKLINEYEKGEVNSVRAFERNQYYNNEITKEDFDKILNPPKKEKEEVKNATTNRFLKKSQEIESGISSEKKTGNYEKLAKEIKDKVDKASSKKGTAKSNPQKAEEYRLKYNNTLERIQELKNEIETKNKNIENFNKELEVKRKAIGDKIDQIDKMRSEVFKQGFGDSDIRDLSGLNENDPKVIKNGIQKELIQKCKNIIEMRKDLNVMQNDLNKDELEKLPYINSRAKDRESKMESLLAAKKLYKKKYEKYAGIIPKKKNKQEDNNVIDTEIKDEKIEKVEIKAEEIKENKEVIEKVKALKVTTHDDLNREFDAVNEEDEEEFDEEEIEEDVKEDAKEDFYSKLKEDTSSMVNDKDNLSKAVENKEIEKDKNIEIE